MKLLGFDSPSELPRHDANHILVEVGWVNSFIFTSATSDETATFRYRRINTTIELRIVHTCRRGSFIVGGEEDLIHLVWDTSVVVSDDGYHIVRFTTPRKIKDVYSHSVEFDLADIIGLIYFGVAPQRTLFADNETFLFTPTADEEDDDMICNNDRRVRLCVNTASAALATDQLLSVLGETLVC